MLDLRLYRASLVPCAVAVLIAAFSLTSPPGPLSSSLPPVAFNATRAAATLARLATTFPHRSPGSLGDDRLAAAIAAELRDADHLHVRTIVSSATTVRGRRRIETVLAQRPGPVRGGIVVVAHRDARGGSARASLSGTAALLELADDLAQSVPRRPLTFVSTSGGSGGDAGAQIAAAALVRPVDAVIVIGDIAGARSRRPYVVAWSGDGGRASSVLTATLDHALRVQLGASPGDPSVLSQLARSALPLAPSEQAPFDDAGLAAVLVQRSGELGPGAARAVSQARLGEFGRGILAAIDALQSGPRLTSATTRDLTIAANRLGGWVVRLLVGLLLLSAALCTLDVLARARRRRVPLAPWVRWVLWWAVPFLAAGLFTKLLAWTGLLSPVPPNPVTPAEVPLGSGGALVLVATVAVFALVAVLRVPRRSLADAQAAAGAPVALLAVGCVLAGLLWIVNPYTAALLVLPLSLWLVVTTHSGRRSRRGGALALICSLAPLGLLLGIEAHDLGLGPAGFAWTWLLVFAGGEVGVGGLLVTALAGAITVCAALVLLHPTGDETAPDLPITVRGPSTYAGPGSLGGTDSALRPRPK